MMSLGRGALFGSFRVPWYADTCTWWPLVFAFQSVTTPRVQYMKCAICLKEVSQMLSAEMRTA